MALARPTRQKIPLRVRRKIAPYQSGQRGVESVHFLFLGDLPATLSFTGPTTLSNLVRTTLTGALSFTGPTNLIKVIGKGITAILSFTGPANLLNGITKGLGNAVLSFTGAFSAGKIVHQALTGTLSFTGIQVRLVGTGLSGALSFTGTITRSIRSTLATAVLGFTGVFIKLTQKRFRTSTAYRDVILADSPVGYWRLGDSGTVGLDSSGNGHPGTYSVGGTTRGTVGAVIGDPDTAVTFDGLSGTLDIPFVSALNPPTTFTVEGWYLAPNAQPFNNPILDCRPASSGALAAGFDLFLNVGTGVGISVCSTGVAQTLLTVAVPVRTVWHHALATYDGTSARLYVDGVLGAGPTACPYTANPTRATAIAHLTAGTNFVDGTLDEIAIYATALSQARVTAHYLAALNSFDSANVVFAGSLLRAIRKGVTATLTFVGVIAKRTSRALVGALSFSGTITKQALKVLSGALGFTGAVATRLALVRALTASLTFSGAVGRNVSAQLASELNFLVTFLGAKLPRLMAFIATMRPTAVSTNIHWYVGVFKQTSKATLRAVSRAIANFITQED